MEKGYWYIASPYSHPDVRVRIERYSQVLEACSLHAKVGRFVFSPIVCWHPAALHHDLPCGWDFWSGYDEVMIRNAIGVRTLLIDGVLESVGVKAEEELCFKLGKPIIRESLTHLRLEVSKKLA